MRWTSSAAVVAALIVAVAADWPAEAATKKKTTAQQKGPAQRTIFISRDETGRKRTHIIVQRRSYLDAGTEVLPGQRKYHDYAIVPYASPFDVLGPSGSLARQPLPARWEYGGRY